MSSDIKRILNKLFVFYIPLTAIILFIIAPILWAVSISLKRPEDIFILPIRYIPHPATFENYIVAWGRDRFSAFFVNSFIISCTAVFFVFLLALCSSYALSRYKFVGKNTFLMILLFTQLIPVIIFIIPLFLIFKAMNLINTPIAIILFYIASQMPFSTILMKGFLDNIPKQIDEAAMVDGASRLRVIFTILPPIVFPGVIATGACTFIGCWNEFTVAFSFTTTANNFTIPVALKMLLAESTVNLTNLAAESIIALSIPLILFSCVQKHLISGLSDGAVKG